MKDLTHEQVIEINKFVQKYHSFIYIPEEERLDKNKMVFKIKYVDTIYDTRTQSYWCIKFRGLGNDRIFTTQSHIIQEQNASHYESLYDWVMDFLNYKFEYKCQ